MLVAPSLPPPRTHTHTLSAGCRQTFLEGDSLAKLVAFIGNKVSQADHAQEAPWLAFSPSLPPSLLPSLPLSIPLPPSLSLHFFTGL